MKYLFLLLISFNSYSFLEISKSKETLQREKFEQKIKKKVSEKFGKFTCVSMNESFEYCENKLHYCYRYKGHKKAGLQCFKH